MFINGLNDYLVFKAEVQFADAFICMVKISAQYWHALHLVHLAMFLLPMY